MTKQIESPKMTKAQAGKLGGLRTVATHGTHYMSAIGYRGACVTAERHHEGDFSLMMSRVSRCNTRPRIYSNECQCWIEATPEEAQVARDKAIAEILALAFGTKALN